MGSVASAHNFGESGTSPAWEGKGNDSRFSDSGGETIVVPLPPRISRRLIQPELMDEPQLEFREHVRALRALARVNTLSLTSWRIWREIRDLAGRIAGPVRVLDVACGGGDVALALKARACWTGVPLEVWGCDASPTALAYARDRAVHRGLEAEFLELDVTREPLPPGFHLVVSSLFLHHLEEPAARDVLVGMARAGERILVQDLLRSTVGYWLAWGTLRLISRSRVAHVDGPRSVQAAFRLREVKALAREAGLEGARVAPCWPQRFLLTWSRR